MYSLVGISFCLLEGFLVAEFGWMSLLWSSLGIVFGFFVSANVFLPILLGVPMASAHLSRKEMRPAVFLALVRAPLIWTILLFLFAWIFPSAVAWISKNETLCIGLAFGCIAILLSPISKKARSDFRIDFDKSYGRYYTGENHFHPGLTKAGDKEHLKEIGAIIKIASNLYFHDMVGAFDAFTFKFSDSRFRCLIFSLSTTVMACEDLIESPEKLQTECLHALTGMVSSGKQSKEFFTGPASAGQAEKTGAVYLGACNQRWREYWEATKSGRNEEAKTILYSMLHALEADTLLQNDDRERLGQLCWQIEFSVTQHSLREAFVSLVSA